MKKDWKGELVKCYKFGCKNNASDKLRGYPPRCVKHARKLKKGGRE